ncbi:MAG: hypothetical protein NTZ10_02410 [Candidatus Saganbacteria bacterium]|nr:hypothetical protein [Candidatus Saganbacteria bacterium]
MASLLNNNIDGKKDRIEFVKSAVLSSAIQKDMKKEPPSSSFIFRTDNIGRYHERLSGLLSPNLPAKELIYLMIRSALEIEFGPSFTLNKGFDKMVNKLADSVMTNPDLRRQALSVVGTVLDKKTGTGKKN